MKSKGRKNNGANRSIRDDELCNSGVGKILMEENSNLKREILLFKKSLKINQDELEKLRSQNHELDKDNGIMKYKLSTIFLPEFLKFISSSIGIGLSVSFFFNKQLTLAGASLFISLIVYGGILFLYQK